MIETREWLVAGKVQGVAFRASARRRAEQLELRGCAANLSDGRVRVVASGAHGALASFAEWLRDGPPAARVDRLDEVPVSLPDADVAALRGFTTR